MRYGAHDLRRPGWAPPQTVQIPDWCGCSTEYLPVPAGDDWWQLVPIWDPAQTPNPLRRGRILRLFARGDTYRRGPPSHD
jgi:hypothetical protein